MRKIQIIKVAFKLGLINVFRVLIYRVRLKVFKFDVSASVDKSDEVFFDYPREILKAAYCSERWVKYIPAFGLDTKEDISSIPNWHRSIIDGKTLPVEDKWFNISDFGAGFGDIKGVWESSRFDWLVSFSLCAASGEKEKIETLNLWLRDWLYKNPPYWGGNWKCGQEASIRVMHLLLAAQILAQVEKPRKELLEIVEIHLARICPTISYAIAQDNNHGTSEAAALYMGGVWLLRAGYPQGARYRRAGRKWLENRARRLIMNDGSFSQYSTNYHRLMLDTYSWVEVWRRLLGEPVFSDMLYQRLRLATDWLANMVTSSSGDTPNLGANDGARLIPLTDTDYRDFRPSVQLATVVFHNAVAYSESGDYDLALSLLGLDKPTSVHDARCNKDYSEGGFAVLRRDRMMVLLRYPVFRFRPSQSDLLHFDLWVDGLNLLRDDGTYSYNSGDEFQSYFGSVEAHNTIQFDERDQMPKLSRFLYGAWPKVKDKTDLYRESGDDCFQAGYRDWKGAEHHRKIRLGDTWISVTDKISGFSKNATLRWRLAPGEWRLDGDQVIGPLCNITVEALNADVSLRLVRGWESRYYSKKTELVVIEVSVNRPCTIISEFHLSP